LLFVLPLRDEDCDVAPREEFELAPKDRQKEITEKGK
jgi:hypothetical protein